VLQRARLRLPRLTKTMTRTIAMVEGDHSMPSSISGAITLRGRRDDMSETYPSGCAGAAIRSEIRHAVALCAADWLGLAATPTFAIMALLTVVDSNGPMAALCAATQGASPLNGMAVMYLLMSAFHSAPWLKLISSRRNGAHRA
jgi:hypothetical protein